MPVSYERTVLKLRKLLILSGAIISIATATNTAQATSQAESVIQLRAGIQWHRNATWHWQDIALVHRTKTEYSEKTTRSRPYLKWLAKQWSNRRANAKSHAQNPPHYNQWICIHKYEGAWNDPNSPYYGGLQMDLSFQRAHGWDALQRWGTADNWHPLTQMWVAERAYVTRGFYPWPNTARYCNLI